MKMNEKRDLAKNLFPHLAWDIMRAETFMLSRLKETDSGLKRKIEVEQICEFIKSASDKQYTVVIIPEKVRRLKTDITEE